MKKREREEKNAAAAATKLKSETCARRRSTLFSFSPILNSKQTMDATKLTGRLALAAMAMAAMQVSGFERERSAGKGRGRTLMMIAPSAAACFPCSLFVVVSEKKKRNEKSRNGIPFHGGRPFALVRKFPPLYATAEALERIFLDVCAFKSTRKGVVRLLRGGCFSFQKSKGQLTRARGRAA